MRNLLSADSISPRTQHGSVLVLVLIMQAILALWATQASQEIRLQQRLVATHWQNTSAFYHAQHALGQITQGWMEERPTGIAHRFDLLTIAPNDCALHHWLSKSAPNAPWQPVYGQQQDAMAVLVIDWQGSGCQARQATGHTVTVVLRYITSTGEAQYFYQTLAGRPLAPVYWAKYP